MAQQELKAHRDGKETRSVNAAVEFQMTYPQQWLEEHEYVAQLWIAG